MNMYKVIERNQEANLLTWQYLLRFSGLLTIGALSSARKSLDLYLTCLRRGQCYAQTTRLTDPPEKWVAGYADVVADCADQSWQDFHNTLQAMMLTRDEALMWADRIDRTLSAKI